ncbi:MAG TPA: GxxExxY protein [Usitatibacter sp.]
MNAVEQGELNAVTAKVISCAYRVSNTLGAGFLEKVYENALAVEMRRSRLAFVQQPGYFVRYRSEVVGDFIPDLVVCDSAIVEIKAVDALTRVHQAQCMNYLRVTGLKVALLLNFGAPRLETRRFVWGF